MVQFLPGSDQVTTIDVSVTMASGAELVGICGGPTCSVLTTTVSLGLSRALELIAVMTTLGGRSRMGKE